MTIARFDRLKLGVNLTGTDLGGGTIQIDAAGGDGGAGVTTYSQVDALYSNYAGLKADAVTYAGLTFTESAATQTYADEGVALPTQPLIDFVGAGVTATDVPASAKTLVSIPGGAGALALLTTVTLASPGSFDVSGISGSYSDLVIVAIVRCNVALTTVQSFLRFNNDSVNNYGYERQSISGTTTTTQDGPANSGVDFGVVPAANVAAGLFSFLEFVVEGYASTTWKKVVKFTNDWALDITATNKQRYIGMAMWNSTAAINRVQLLVNNADPNFATGSQLRIYGRT